MNAKIGYLIREYLEEESKTEFVTEEEVHKYSTHNYEINRIVYFYIEDDS